MEEKNIGYIIANFGGPRSLDEIAPFLTALLTDKDVLRTPLPQFLHSPLFGWIARRRAPKVQPEYEHMGGCSPIYRDTEQLAEKLRHRVHAPIIPFHRYLPATHEAFKAQVAELQCDEIRVFPLFPQFTYATTGSVARWFERYLPKETLEKLRWIKSYPGHPAFVRAHQGLISEFMEEQGLEEKESILFFSAHGIPQKFVDTGDIYPRECRQSFEGVMRAFPDAQGILAFQSKFGPGEWMKPYTIDMCESIKEWCGDKKNVVFVPISFTSDHIETLCEIENDYMTVVREQGLKAYRVPALTLHPLWIEAILEILQESNLCGNRMLVY